MFKNVAVRLHQAHADMERICSDFDDELKLLNNDNPVGNHQAHKSHGKEDRARDRAPKDVLQLKARCHRECAERLQLVDDVDAAFSFLHIAGSHLP